MLPPIATSTTTAMLPLLLSTTATITTMFASHHVILLLVHALEFVVRGVVLFSVGSGVSSETFSRWHIRLSELVALYLALCGCGV